MVHLFTRYAFMLCRGHPYFCLYIFRIFMRVRSFYPRSTYGVIFCSKELTFENGASPYSHTEGVLFLVKRNWESEWKEI
jgi:hypothetical protein